MLKFFPILPWHLVSDVFFLKCFQLFLVSHNKKNSRCCRYSNTLGLLTGKYTQDNVDNITGPRKQLFKKTVGKPDFANLLSAMKTVANEHSGANLAQVAINYCRAKNTIPIPGARNLRQVQSNYGSLDWSMSSDEVKLLDKASSNLSYIDPSASPFPKQDKDTGLKMFDS